MVSELCRQQGELQNLLTKKDAEIEDYKADGAKVSRSKSLLRIIVLASGMIQSIILIVILAVFFTLIHQCVKHCILSTSSNSVKKEIQSGGIRTFLLL